MLGFGLWPALAWGVPLEHHAGAELTLAVVQLNSSHGRAKWGGQIRLTVSIDDRVELVESLTLLARRPGLITQNDLRLRVWGDGAGSWHPAYAAELGYLFQSEDWLALDAQTRRPRHGVLMGGTWRFPLDVLDEGFTLAKWAYVIRPKSRNMTVFNCFAHWHVAQDVGVHIGGDIYTAYGDLKYSGFTVGGTVSARP